MDAESAESDSLPSAKTADVNATDKVSDTKSQDIASNNEPGDIGSSGSAPALTSNSDVFATASNNKHPGRISNDRAAVVGLSNISPATASTKASNDKHTAATEHGSPAPESSSSMLSGSKLSSWATSLKFPQPVRPPQDNLPTGSSGMSAFARFTSEFGLRLPSITPSPYDSAESTSSPTKDGVLESFTKGLVDTSVNAVKAMQVKARHIVSQNKRRYQEGEFDLDMTYITENIIAMGFPAGDISSGIFGFFEGFYRNHMEEVIKFFETHHEVLLWCTLNPKYTWHQTQARNLIYLFEVGQMLALFTLRRYLPFCTICMKKGKYKVYNLCSERLYDASLFEGKVACFPFDDHNCPPLQLIPLFCQSAYSWLKEDILNVVVVHCKAGMARTGLMICSLLLFLKFFPTAEEAIEYYNQKRCLDGKALVLPSQIRYVKYFERVLTYFDGEVQPGRRCMLRGFRLHRCPYWIRPSITISNHNGVLFSTKKHPKTKDLMPEDFWISAPKKGMLVFALPGQPGLTELVGDFKIHFHDRHGDFYCWLNTTMTENRKILDAADLDGFDKRKFPSPGFQVEVIMIDSDGIQPTKSKANSEIKRSDESSGSIPVQTGGLAANSNKSKETGKEDNDDVFSDSEGEETSASKSRRNCEESNVHTEVESVPAGTRQLSERNDEPRMNNVSNEQTVKPASRGEISHVDSVGASNIKAMAADASVFSFGDEEDYESE